MYAVLVDRTLFGKKEEEQERAEILARRDSLNVHHDEYKAGWDKHGVIQFKNERFAILLRSVGAIVQFLAAFDMLTQEGYELKAIDGGKEATASALGGGISSYYYFQKGV